MAYYLYGNKFRTLDDLNKSLAAEFWRGFGDVFGDDKVRLGKSFNNWTLFLCKVNRLCDNGYYDCTLEYSAEDAKKMGWL